MPRFVLLRHELPPGLAIASHWDFMLEADSALMTWRLAELPQPGGAAVAAIKLEDHRLEYLNYEGPVSGGRGDVRRIDRGEFEWIEQAEERVVVNVDGERLRGVVRIERSTADAWALAVG